MSKSEKVGLTRGAVLLLVQSLLAGVVVPGLVRIGEHGKRAASEAVLGGLGLIVFGLLMIAIVLFMRHRAPSTTRGRSSF